MRSLPIIQTTTARFARRKRAGVCSVKQLCSTADGRERLVVDDLRFDHVNSMNDERVDKLRQFYQRQHPVVLHQYANHLPAMERWKNLEYLESVVGPSLVACDVEVGAYNQGEKLTIPFVDYVNYLRIWKEQYEEDLNANVPSEHLLYLAQNDLNAFGSLSDDIPIPFFCTDSSGGFGHGRLYSTMLWMGPRGCLSPLHFDPLDNLIIQVVGRKHVTLLSKDTDPNRLYTGESYGQQSNTSAVNVETPDLERFPDFEQVVPMLMSTTLHPGDALFIPSRWWHQVRSLDLSISVNAWWR